MSLDDFLRQFEQPYPGAEADAGALRAGAGTGFEQQRGGHCASTGAAGVDRHARWSVDGHLDGR